MGETKINWHPSTETPGKKRFVGAFIKKGRSERQLSFYPIRYFSGNVKPCETIDAERDELCVAWCYYEDFIKGITPEMIASAKAGAWGWWKEDKK